MNEPSISDHILTLKNWMNRIDGDIRRNGGGADIEMHKDALRVAIETMEACYDL